MSRQVPLNNLYALKNGGQSVELVSIGGSKNSIAEGAILAYSIPALSIATSVGRSLIYEHIRGGSLKITKIGRRTVILHEDAVRWLRQLQAGTRQAEPISATNSPPGGSALAEEA